MKQNKRSEHKDINDMLDNTILQFNIPKRSKVPGWQHTSTQIAIKFGFEGQNKL